MLRSSIRSSVRWAALTLTSLLTLPGVAHGGQVVAVELAAPNCSTQVTGQARLERSARAVSVASPSVGDLLDGAKADTFPKAGIARITGISATGPVIRVTAAPVTATCLSATLPGEPSDSPWLIAVDLDVSYTVANHSWARGEVRQMLRSQGGEGFAYRGSYRIACKRTRIARYRCRLSAFAGDSLITASGRIWLEDSSGFTRYSFRAVIYDDYCIAVLKRPVRKCRRIARWRA